MRSAMGRKKSMPIAAAGRAGAALFLATLALAAACAPPAPRVVEGRTEVLFSGPDCGREEALGVRWVEDTPELRRSFEDRSGEDDEEAPRPPAASPTPGRLLVLVETGRKPTGGYSIGLADPLLRVEKGVARLRVALREPAPGDEASAWPTSPCLVVALPGLEFATLEVVDAAGTPLGTLAVPVPPEKRSKQRSVWPR